MATTATAQRTKASRGEKAAASAPESAPLKIIRQFQPGDIVEGENPVGNTIRGMVQDVGNKWLRLADKKGGVQITTARLIEAATEEPEIFSLTQFLRDSLGFVPLDLYGETEPNLDQDPPIEHRGWQIGTESPNGGMLAVDICSSEGEWWSRDTEFTEPTFDYHDYEGAIAWAKGCIDQAIALQEKLSGQTTIPLEIEPVAAVNEPDANDESAAEVRTVEFLLHGLQVRVEVEEWGDEVGFHRYHLSFHGPVSPTGYRSTYADSDDLESLKAEAQKLYDQELPKDVDGNPIFNKDVCEVVKGRDRGFQGEINGCVFEGKMCFLPDLKPSAKPTSLRRVKQGAKSIEILGDLNAPSAKVIATEIIPADPADRLAQLEDDVQAGLGLIEKGKARIWAACESIRSEELWKLNGHESFEAYCKARWGWAKSNANENALAGEVLKSLAGIPVEELPTSTSAMAELNKVEPEQRIEVLQQAREANGGKPTAKAIREVVQQTAEPEEDEPIYLDASGQPIAIGDTVVSTAAHGLTGTVEAFEPESFLPVVIRTATGSETKARPGSLQVVDDELPVIAAEIAQQPASPDADALSKVQAVLEPYRGLIEVGAVVVDRYRPYLPLIVAEVSETQACCWDTFDETWIGWGQLEPYEGETSLSLESIVQGRLQRLLQVAGKDAVLSLLEEV